MRVFFPILQYVEEKKSHFVVKCSCTRYKRKYAYALRLLYWTKHSCVVLSVFLCWYSQLQALAQTLKIKKKTSFADSMHRLRQNIWVFAISVSLLQCGFLSGLLCSGFVDRLVDKTIMISFGWQTLPFIACSCYLCSQWSLTREKYREIAWNHVWLLLINRNEIFFSIFHPRISTENHYSFIYWVITITCAQLWSMCTIFDPIVGLS